jgi:hypothetical protein
VVIFFAYDTKVNSKFQNLTAQQLQSFGQYKKARIVYPELVVSCSPGLPFKLGDPGSILGPTSTQGLKIIEEKVLPLH